MPIDTVSSLGNNPFAVLTFIAAPALLTNASSVLALGTSNRFARAVDRARLLAAKLDAEQPAATSLEVERLWLSQLDAAERRVIFVVRALSAFYIAVGSFALATLSSLLGASLVAAGTVLGERVAQWVALGAGIAGVGAVMAGATLLVLESRMTRAVLLAEADLVRRRLRERREHLRQRVEEEL